jgi:glycosyltransferase involved in cell wall biosynthesis
MTIRFAAFVMTYKRTDTLSNTIHKLFQQTYPPQKVLIIDNDSEQSAKYLSQDFSHLPIEYLPVGYNSGPAGAAKKGLEALSEKDYDWISWIDDDDPPIFDNTFEILLQLALKDNRCGCVGTVGQRFNKKNGLIDRITDAELEGEGFFQVDNIAGGMCKIINAEVVNKSAILPDDELFFGFEELDFDLRLQQAGYILLVDKVLYKKHRSYYNRMNLNINRGKRKSYNRLWREYYSTRNTLKILQKNKKYKAISINLMRFILKSIIGFRYGLQYGLRNAKYIFRGIFHFLLRKKGPLH